MSQNKFITRIEPKIEGFRKLLNIMSNLTGLYNKKIIPRTSSKISSIKFLLSPIKKSDMPENIFRINKNKEIQTVVGIDATCEVRAETIDGFVIAVRATMVEKTGSKYKLNRICRIVHINPTTIKEYSELNLVSASWKTWRLACRDIEYAKKFAMQIVEQMMISMAIQKHKNSIILIDGSLDSSRDNIEIKNHSLKDMILNARINNNQLIAISKSSKLFKLYPKHLRSVYNMGSPAAVELDNINDHLMTPSNNKVYFSTLGKSTEPLRIDIPGYLDPHSIFNSLISSDIIQSGYPETLKRAHIYSKFSFLEKIAIDRKIKKSGATWVPSDDIRDTFFGNVFNNNSGDLN